MTDGIVMNEDRLRLLQRFDPPAEYRVEIDPAGSSHDWFYLNLYYRETRIGRWTCCKSFRLARWRVRRMIRQHRKFVAVTQSEGASL